MTSLRLWIVLSWIALPTVMYGGYSLFRLINQGDRLTPFQTTWFRAGHAHAGVLLLMSLLYYLFLDQTIYDRENFEGAKWVMTPALREKWNQEELWQGLKFRDLETIATDHCPFCFKDQKELGRESFTKIPNGAPGVENRMSLVFDGGVNKGRISLNRFVELTSTSPAKIFGLFPRKGTIAPGSDADIVVFDPERKMRLAAKTLHMKVDYSPYEGREVTGVTDTVISRGRIVIDGGKFTGKAGSGAFLRRNTR